MVFFNVFIYIFFKNDESNLFFKQKIHISIIESNAEMLIMVGCNQKELWKELGNYESMVLGTIKTLI